MSLSSLLKNTRRVASSIVAVARDPGNLDQVFAIGDAIDQSGLPRRMAEHAARRSPEVAALIQARYSPKLADLDELARLPEGTLGRTFADHMRAHGFAVAFFPEVAASDDGHYLVQRLRHTHDIWHVVTGIGTDPVGELALQAFMLAQLGTPLSVALIAAGVLRNLLHPRELAHLVSELRRGYRLGQRSRPLLAQRFEDHWERPLSAWQAEVGTAAA